MEWDHAFAAPDCLTEHQQSLLVQPHVWEIQMQQFLVLFYEIAEKGDWFVLNWDRFGRVEKFVGYLAALSANISDGYFVVFFGF